MVFRRPSVYKLADKQNVRGLIKALRYPESFDRSTAAEKLGQLRDARAVDPLASALRDPEWTVRHSAAEALEALGDSRAIDPLIEALSDRSAAGMAAARALVELGDPRAVEPLIGNGYRTNAFKLLVKLRDRRATDVLLDSKSRGMFGDPETKTVFLTELADDRVLPWLLTVLEDEDPDIRAGAAEALGTLGDPAAVEPLATAAASLDRISSREALLARGTALKAIHRIFVRLQRETAVEPLFDLLDSDESWVRDYAAFVLGGLDGPDVLARLEETLGAELDGARANGEGVATDLEAISRPPATGGGDREYRDRDARFAASERLRRRGVGVGRQERQ
jgi:HEAT repeat protein